MIRGQRTLRTNKTIKLIKTVSPRKHCTPCQPIRRHIPAPTRMETYISVFSNFNHLTAVPFFFNGKEFTL